MRGEVLDHSKLLVRNLHDDDLTFLWKHILDTANMYSSILHTGAMAYVDRVLEHDESILEQLASKARGRLTLSSGVGREIEEDKHPHNTVFT